MSEALVFIPASKNEALGWWFTTQSYSFRDVCAKAPIGICAACADRNSVAEAAVVDSTKFAMIFP